MSVKKRLKDFIKNKNLSVSAFEKSINASNGYVNSISKSIGVDKLNLILEIYPNLDIQWLLTGAGEMIKTEEKLNEAEKIDFSKMNVMMVPLVSKFAYAGYLDNMGDNEYFEDLPLIAFANDVQNRGDYLAFEVKGDSMDSGLSNSIIEGDILLARNVHQDYWASKLHIKKWNFIIVHKDRGILIKRITSHDINTNQLKLHSLNDYYNDININLKDVQAIFNVVDIKRKPIL
jgi:phage repressor protein C with HTH and peptisase S24 domain